MECLKNIIHYESTIIISLPCIQLAKLKSCSVWCFSEKKKAVVTWGGGHGAFGPPPVGCPAPTYPLTRTKMAKISHFWLFLYFCPLTPPHNTPPHPNKNNLVQPLEKGLCTFKNSWDWEMDFDSRQISLSVLFLELPDSILWFCG